MANQQLVLSRLSRDLLFSKFEYFLGQSIIFLLGKDQAPLLDNFGCNIWFTKEKEERKKGRKSTGKNPEPSFCIEAASLEMETEGK